MALKIAGSTQPEEQQDIRESNMMVQHEVLEETVDPLTLAGRSWSEVQYLGLQGLKRTSFR